MELPQYEKSLLMFAYEFRRSVIALEDCDRSDKWKLREYKKMVKLFNLVWVDVPKNISDKVVIYN